MTVLEIQSVGTLPKVAPAKEPGVPGAPGKVTWEALSNMSKDASSKDASGVLVICSALCEFASLKCLRALPQP